VLPRSPLSSVRNVDTAWKSRSLSIDKSSRLSYTDMITEQVFSECGARLTGVSSEKELQEVANLVLAHLGEVSVTTFLPPMETIPDLSDFRSLSGSTAGSLSLPPIPIGTKRRLHEADNCVHGRPRKRPRRPIRCAQKSTYDHDCRSTTQVIYSHFIFPTLATVRTTDASRRARSRRSDHFRPADHRWGPPAFWKDSAG
jgi:hypothetical protein